MSQLFTPLELRDVTVRNRTVVAPMWQYCGENGMPTDWHLMHLGRFADGGAGIVFQEATAVERRGCGTTGDLGIWDDSFVPALARVAGAVESFGAVPAIQLGHAGRKSRTKRPVDGTGELAKTADMTDWDDWEPIAPSAVPLKEGYAPPRQMSLQDINQVIEAYATAARRAKDAGYKILEVHAAHGYLINQFLSEHTNHRKDRYGGSHENRDRFLYEVVAAVRSEWPEDLPLFVRLSCIDPAGWGMQDTLRVAETLKQLGVDVIDCSTGGIGGSPLKSGGIGASPGHKDASLTYGYQVPYSNQVRNTVGIKTMTVGLMVHPRHAEQVVANGDADLVAIAREALHNPNWSFHAALKLGVEDPYKLLRENTAWWLQRRESSVPNIMPSALSAL